MTDDVGEVPPDPTNTPASRQEAADFLVSAPLASSVCL